MSASKNSDKGFLDGHTLDGDSVRLLPHIFCITHNVVMLDRVDPSGDDPILLGMANPHRVDIMDLVSTKFSGRRVDPVALPLDQVTRAINVGFGYDKLMPSDRKVEAVEKKQSTGPDYELSSSVEDAGNVDGLQPVTHTGVEDRPIVEIVNRLLLEALKRGATDIHIENERRGVQVRFKLDGMLYKVGTPLAKDNVEEVVSRIKIMCDLDISEHRAPQDGRILYRTIRDGVDYEVPFRVSILPGPFGEEVVLRVLDKSMAPINLELLGFTNLDLVRYRSLIENPQGMILVSGPTGSGKTTTLYATLKEINTPYNKILSAEDPIEYHLDGVNQKQINPKFGFSEMARAFLRHDPDILLIGEIRDDATADVSVRAAQTGHLILSTIHTNDSIGSIARLETLGVSRNMVGSSLLGVLSQRLVRRICDNCKQTYVPSDKIMRIFGDHLASSEFFSGKGCEECNRTGYQERIGIFELFVIDDELQDMILLEANPSDILTKALIKGMIPLTADGLLKVQQGITTVEELVRVIPKRQIKAQLQRQYVEA
jgi:type II secretory ATPase GspE/PulE/Tfp pilus assembly ATPase PilB-like protein